MGILPGRKKWTIPNKEGFCIVEVITPGGSYVLCD